VEPKALTSRTVTDKNALRALIAEAGERGYATTVDQLDYGITALAVPIRNAEGRVTAAVNSSGYSGLVSPEQMVTDRLGDLRVAAGRISAAAARTPALSAALNG
jgi:IclR family pca regulon transcriptional regulator